MASWVVPGAALESGKGWKLWLSSTGNEAFPSGPVTVRDMQGQIHQSRTVWSLQSPLPGLDRKIGIATVSLRKRFRKLLMISAPQSAAAKAILELATTLENSGRPTPETVIAS